MLKKGQRPSGFQRKKGRKTKRVISMKVLLNQTVALIVNRNGDDGKRNFYMLWYKMNHMIKVWTFLLLGKKKVENWNDLEMEDYNDDRESGKWHNADLLTQFSSTRLLVGFQQIVVSHNCRDLITQERESRILSKYSTIVFVVVLGSIRIHYAEATLNKIVMKACWNAA